MKAVVAEFFGTAILVLLGNGVVANVLLEKTKGNGAGWIVVTAGWAFAVFSAVICTAELSGAHLNPAVTVGLALNEKFEMSLVPGYLAAQMLGAFFGALLVYLCYLDHYKATTDGDRILGTFCTAPAVRNVPINLVCEALGTAVLVLAVLSFASPTVQFSHGGNDMPLKVGLGSVGAVQVALIVFSIGLSLGGPTGYAINPARDLGPRLMHALLPIRNKRDSDWSYAWVPVAGPILGAVAAVLLYKVMNP